ncbi:MAG: hypothetical protein QF745_04465 [Planctomycetota bacterium]|nr:hypothetical protein [Planctomycetota bacterium]
MSNRDDAMLALAKGDDTEDTTAQTRMRSFGEKRDVRVQFLLTKSEFEAMDSKLTRKDKLSDYIRDILRNAGTFDPPTPEPESR